MYVPTIIEKTANWERARDIFSRLVEDRIIYLSWGIDDNMANLIIAQLLYLNKKDPKKDIIMYINSPGGSIVSGMAIYDTMQMISNDVVTICTGLSASMGSMLLTAWTKWKRYSLPHGEILIHQPLIGGHGVSWQASDIEIVAQNLSKTKKRMNQTLAYHSGKTLKQIEKDTDRDNYMTAEEAVAYWLIDKVIGAYDLRKEIGEIK